MTSEMRFTYGPVVIEIGESDNERARSLDERIAIAEHVGQEARKTLEQQIDTLTWIDEKAGRMMRVNILFLGIILSGFSFLIGQEIVRDNVSIFNLYTIVGLGLTVFSISVSALAYTASNTVGGIKGNAINDIFESEYSEVQVKEGIASSYEDWIRGNRQPVVTNALWITASAILLTAGLIFLSIGVIHAVAFPVSVEYSILALAIIIVYTFYSGFFGHLSGWANETSPKERIWDRLAGAKNYLCGDRSR